ncbi:hypothetical protein TrRE_jg2693 [Triparma retinervis]|uniref:Uncharacterized protein n=1 Tax=Triparma retinervis TaxID=2557542 RepID=A0A9W7DM19_9STRA|nr:hypothetical protein TrRE_jg2693 [Triparma retinervis]
MSNASEFTLDNTGRVPFEGALNTTFRSFRDFVGASDRSDSRLFADMKCAMTARETGGEQYSAGDTFFVPASGVARCGLEALALSIFHHHAKDAKFDPSRSGAEWWTQVIDVRDDIGVHFDRDYGMEEFGLNVHPHVATVTYLSDKGGPTVVLEHTSGCEVGEDFSGSVDKVFMSYPEAGKHMSFDGRFLHLAPTDLMGRGEKRRGLRYTFLVNVWLNHIPINSDLMPDEFLSNMSWMAGVGKKSAASNNTLGNFGSEMDCEKVQFGTTKRDQSKFLSLKFILDDYKGKLTFPAGGGGGGGERE